MLGEIQATLVTNDQPSLYPASMPTRQIIAVVGSLRGGYIPPRFPLLHVTFVTAREPDDIPGCQR